MKRSKLTRFRNLLLLMAISMVAIEMLVIDRKYYDYSMATIDLELVVGSDNPALFPGATRSLTKSSSSSGSNNNNNNNSTITKDDNAQQSLPLLVLHVGPGATGMAAIQATLAGNHDFLFSEDNYIYIYIGNNNNTNNGDADVGDLSRPYSCKNKSNNNHGTDERRSDKNSLPEGCIPALSPSLERLLDNNTVNMVGSSQLLADPKDHERMLWVEHTRHKWDVRVVVSYRRLHELLPETYDATELHHRRKNRDCLHQWPDGHGTCREIRSFVDYLEREADLSKHEFVRTYQAWSKSFPVSVWNVHPEERDDPSANFVCHAMPGADKTCQRLKSKSNANTTTTGESDAHSSTNTNNSNNNNDTPVALSSQGDLLLDYYDRLAVRAYEEGLVHEIDNRRELGLAIQKHHNATTNQWNSSEDAFPMMPLVCPHQDKLDELYQASLEFESWALALSEPRENNSIATANDFDESWEETLRRKKLCSLDASQALKHEEWREFFRLRYATKTMEHFYVR